MSNRQRVTKKNETGFTLLEIIVAMFIFSFAVVALLQLMGDGARTTSYLEEKFFAQLSAHNQLVNAILGDPSDEGQVTNAGYVFEWSLKQYPTDIQSMVRYEIVLTKQETEQQVAKLVAFKAVSP